ncbi:MAG: pyridoxal 5'-phosphate synthase glutaminase subunit PdxT [Calditrichaeota bacterium]|nr:pyridoxal 5'-phosphate synthase glutaminase subunit PdxT [Calditrichota bacterium]RQW04598.1 MAG: pyridoxal 5'-phosphate synthase glutaminase subunit PdxT [Calditrichota bacterium]
MKIGILAIQGDFELHRKMLSRLNVDTVLVKSPADLEKCDGLIIPGGESTTFIKLLKVSGLFAAVKQFSQAKAIMGTCAGLITLARKVTNFSLETLDLIDLDVARNAYGRQIDSFIGEVALHINGRDTSFEGVFIRAPRIEKTGQGIRSLAFYQGDVVLAENENILVATFHPELTEDTRIHEYFIRKIQAKIQS